jgi:molybdate transport system substrate-binding protein
MILGSMAIPALAQTGALRVLAGGSLSVALQALAPRHEAVSGQRLDILFAPTPQLIAEAISGRPFDLGVVPVDVFSDAAARARFSAVTPIARVGYGVAVRAGASRPDIGSPEALRATLLAAQAVSTLPASAAGAFVLSVFERLGIAAEMQARLRAQTTTGGITAAVINGDAELAVFLTNVLAVPGVDVVGPLPAPLQQELIFGGAIAAGTPNAAAAGAFLAFLRGPEGVAGLRERGLTPG